MDLRVIGVGRGFVGHFSYSFGLSFSVFSNIHIHYYQHDPVSRASKHAEEGGQDDTRNNRSDYSWVGIGMVQSHDRG